MWLRRLVAIAGGLALAIAALGLAELAARLINPVSPAELADLQAREFQLWSQGPCYRVQGVRLVRISPPKAFDLHVDEASSDVPLVKPPGVRRIVVVGESTGEMLERAMTALVEQGGCKDRVEVLQCSATGSRADTAVRRAQEALAYSPDAIVVAIGHNFLLNAPPTVAQVRQEKSRLVHEIRRLFVKPPPPPPSLPAPRIDPATVGREAYEQITAAAKAKGVQIVALLLSSNYWFPPNVEPGYLESVDRAGAWMKWARGDVQGAITALSPDTGHEGPMRAFERGRFRAEAGDWAAARHDLAAARDIEKSPTRASTATTLAIALAAQKGGATLVDAETLLSQSADHEIPGWDVFLDNCHPHPAPLDLLAKTVLRTAAPKSACRLTSNHPADSSATDPYERLVRGPASLRVPANLDANAANGDWRRRVDGPVLALLHDAPNEAQALLEKFDTEELSHHPREVRAAMLDAIGDVARDHARMDLARWAVEKATSVSPTAAEWIDVALLRLHAHDEDGAKQAVERALTLDPPSLWAQNVRAAMAKN